MDAASFLLLSTLLRLFLLRSLRQAARLFSLSLTTVPNCSSTIWPDYRLSSPQSFLDGIEPISGDYIFRNAVQNRLVVGQGHCPLSSFGRLPVAIYLQGLKGFVLLSQRYSLPVVNFRPPGNQMLVTLACRSGPCPARRGGSQSSAWGGRSV